MSMTLSIFLQGSVSGIFDGVVHVKAHVWFAGDVHCLLRCTRESSFVVCG